MNSPNMALKQSDLCYELARGGSKQGVIYLIPVVSSEAMAIAVSCIQDN